VALSASTAVPTSLTSLLAELDIQVPADRTSLVVDHFNYAADNTSAEAHDVLLLPPPKPVRSDVKDFFSTGAGPDDVLAFPHGQGVTLGASALLNPVLRAPATAYSYNPKEQVGALTADDVFAAGTQLSLVSAFQARNSARVALVGSAEMLQDKWFDAEVTPASAKGKKKTFNREFAKRLSGWTFQELGVLRTNWIEHRLDEPGDARSNETNPKIYRIKNNVVCTPLLYLLRSVTPDISLLAIHHLPLGILLGHLDRLHRPRQRRHPA
jgi:oligosaccharyltransferase complex subunit beta